MRIRSWLVGGEEGAWDAAVPCGAVLAATVVAALFARGSQLDDMPPNRPLGGCLFLVFAVGSALLTAWPLATTMLSVVGLSRARPWRRHAWWISALIVGLAAGVIAPLALRAAWSASTDWRPAWDPLAWTLPDVAVTAITGAAPDADPVVAARNAAFGTATRGAAWIAFLVSWLSCLPLVRQRRRLRVGWPVALILGGIAVSAQFVRAWMLGSEASLGRVLIVAGLTGATPLLAWGFVAWASRRWGVEEAGSSAPRLLSSRVVAATFVAAALVTAAWCAFLATASPPAWRAVVASLREPPRVGAAAPAFTLTEVGGGTVGLSDLHGRPVLIAFWASWCGPCRAEFPHLVELSDGREADGLVVLAISKDSDRAAMDAFLAEQPARPRVLVADEDVLAAYDVNGIPVTYLIDAYGRIAWRHIGFRRDRASELQEAVDALDAAR